MNQSMELSTGAIQVAETDETGTPVSGQIRWPAPWRDQKILTVQQLLELPENWDSYGAKRVDPRSVAAAVHRLHQIAGVTEAEPIVGASPSGWVVLSWNWDHDSKSLELEFLPDGRVAFAYVDIADPSKDVERIIGRLGDVFNYIPGA